MSSAYTGTGQIENIRIRTIGVLDNLTEKAGEYRLSEAPNALSQYRRKIIENTYQVLVVGEAKRGKSSLINALIGRPVLPTDVDIATSQVFRVAQAPREAYRVRYEDDSSKEITAAQLPDYGSQAVIDLKGLAFDQIPRWIEVDLPTIEFLPRGVSILDTPGLGSLYAAHAQITQRFVPQADAVIFVLDSEKPIIKSELDFIENILGVTRNIFFVQTKIDQYDDEHWLQIQRRNESILAERFNDRPRDVQVWPVSSTNLMLAAQTGDKDYLEVSYYSQLADALKSFLFRVAGWSRCLDALVVADHYQNVTKKQLEDHLSELEETSTGKLSDLQRASAERKQQFDTEWGSQGKKNRELKDSIRRVVATNRQNFTDYLAQNGTLEKTYWQKIEVVKSIEEANRLGEDLDAQVRAEVTEKWHTVSEESRIKCVALLGSLIEASDELVPSIDAPELEVHGVLVGEIKGDVWDKFEQSQSEFLKAGAVSANAVLIALYLFPATIVPLLPIAIPAVVAAGVWAAIRKWKAMGISEVKKAQQELQDHLSTTLNQIRDRFLHPDTAYNDQSLVNYYFNTLVEAMHDQIQQVVESKSREAQEADIRLTTEIAMDEQQRKSKAELMRQQLTDWEAIGRSIIGMVTDIQNLERSLAASATAGA